MNLFRALAVIVVFLAAAGVAQAQAPPTLGPTCTATWTEPTTDTSGNPIAAPLTHNFYVDPTPAGGPIIGTTVPTVKGVGASPQKCPPLSNATHTFWMTVVDANNAESAAVEAVPDAATAPGPFVFKVGAPNFVTGAAVKSP